MANFFQKIDPVRLTPRQTLERQYASSRGNLLFAIVLTVLNLVMLLLNVDMYFLFSIFIPYYIATVAWYLCGKLPPDYYDGGIENYEFFDSSLLVGALVVAVVMIAIYVLCFVFSKRKVGWLIAALVLFAIDTVLLLAIQLPAGADVSIIVDILFHAWVLFYLIQGIRAHTKLKDLPEEEIPEEATVAAETEGETAEAATFDGFEMLSNATTEDAPKDVPKSSDSDEKKDET